MSAAHILVVDDDEVELEIMIDTLSAAFPGAAASGEALTSVR